MTDKRRQILDAALAPVRRGWPAGRRHRLASPRRPGGQWHPVSSLSQQGGADQSPGPGHQAAPGAAITEADAAPAAPGAGPPLLAPGHGLDAGPPRESQVRAGLFPLPLLARPCSSQILAETLHFLPSLLARGQASGELMSAPRPDAGGVPGPVSGLRLPFVDQPELGKTPTGKGAPSPSSGPPSAEVPMRPAPCLPPADASGLAACSGSSAALLGAAPPGSTRRCAANLPPCRTASPSGWR